jgi:hypothetical protein
MHQNTNNRSTIIVPEHPLEPRGSSAKHSAPAARYASSLHQRPTGAAPAHHHAARLAGVSRWSQHAAADAAGQEVGLRRLPGGAVAVPVADGGSALTVATTWRASSTTSEPLGDRSPIPSWILKLEAPRGLLEVARGFSWLPRGCPSLPRACWTLPRGSSRLGEGRACSGTMMCDVVPIAPDIRTAAPSANPTWGQHCTTPHCNAFLPRRRALQVVNALPAKPPELPSSSDYSSVVWQSHTLSPFSVEVGLEFCEPYSFRSCIPRLCERTS